MCAAMKRKNIWRHSDPPIPIFQKYSPIVAYLLELINPVAEV